MSEFLFLYFKIVVCRNDVKRINLPAVIIVSYFSAVHLFAF